MNKSLFILVIVLLCFKSILHAQEQSIQFYYFNSDKVRSSEQNFQYYVTPYSNSRLQISANSSDEKRLHFNQDSNQSQLMIDLLITKHYFNSKFETGYDYLFDDNDLEINLYPYQSKTAFTGYGVDLHLVDSLMVYSNARYYYRNENDRYNANRQLISKGYSYQVGSRYGWDIFATEMGINAFLEQKKLQWDYYQTKQIGSYLRLSRETYNFNTDFTFSDRSDDFYFLQANPELYREYQLSDIQKKKSYLSISALQIYPADNIELTFQNNFSHRQTQMHNNANRDNDDLNNDASCALHYYPIDNLHLSSEFQFNYNVKDFVLSQNSRQTQLRNLNNGITWEYSSGDSLVTLYQIGLQRTEYPDDEHKWDNDLLDQSYRIGLIHYYKTKVKLINWLSWSIRDDVYPNALLSSNNNHINSINWHPECNILLSDRLALLQSYSIRTDYTNYVYNSEQRSDNLYRQLMYQYRLVFDSYPYVARIGDAVWLRLPYRKATGNVFKMEMAYQYEHNEYGDKYKDFYIISSKTKRHIAELVFKYEMENFYYTVQPKYSWGTWKENAMLLGAAWQFNRESIIELSINPTGEKLSELDWRISFNVNLRF